MCLAGRTGEDVAVVFMSLQFRAGAGEGTGGVAGTGRRMWHKSNTSNALAPRMRPTPRMKSRPAEPSRVIEQKLRASRSGPASRGTGRRAIRPRSAETYRQRLRIIHVDARHISAARSGRILNSSERADSNGSRNGFSALAGPGAFEVCNSPPCVVPGSPFERIFRFCQRICCLSAARSN